MNASSLTVRQGDVIADRYVVERVLGGGAMGVVVLALHIDLQERRAIKLMSHDALVDPQGVERFFREARAAVRLKSEHVARVHDMGRLPDQSPFIVLEYLEGSDLKRMIETRGQLPIGEAVGYLLQACEAIGEAHSLGIVHRDLKPANLFVTRNVNGGAMIKVFDFGIAKLVGPQQSVSLTSTSSMLGTPLYMSPEQMRGAANVDARTDIWALGAVLYCMLTGRTPFVGSTVTEICAAVIADPPTPPHELRRDLPPALEHVILRCLEKQPADRFNSVSELVQAIAPFAAATPSAVGAALPPNAPNVGADHSAPQGALGRPVQAAPAALATVSGPAATLGGSTGQASWWSAQNSPPTHPAGSSSRRLAALALAVIAAACAVFFFLNQRGNHESSATALQPSEPPAVAPAKGSASAPASGVASATAALSALSADVPAVVPSAQATHSSSAMAGPPPKVPAPVATPPKDAFGRDRK